MALRNSAVQAVLDSCSSDLKQVSAVMATLGGVHVAVPYLTMFSLVRACGSVEVAFKSIVVDHCESPSKVQVKNYLRHSVRERARNPNYSNMCALLGEFDEGWSKSFKDSLGARADKEQLIASLQSLVDARNEFAHGGTPKITFNDIEKYFDAARAAMEHFDSVVV